MTAVLPPLTPLTAEEVFAHALRGETCHLATSDGDRHRLPVEDWARPADAGDELLLSLCAGPTIDIGCGPGRLTAELAARGRVALGIDLVHEAVGQTRRRGGTALRRDVFSRLPGEGRWQTALLADGNIGIGGDPVALLHRVRRLLTPGGSVVVETAPPRHRTTLLQARLECACGQSEPFGWAVVGIDDIAAIAARAGLVLAGHDHGHGRWVALLREAGS